MMHLICSISIHSFVLLVVFAGTQSCSARVIPASLFVHDDFTNISAWLAWKFPTVLAPTAPIISEVNVASKGRAY